MKKRILSETLRHHFTYNSWKYVLVLALVVMGVSLAYSMTEPRIPEERSIDVIVCGINFNQGFSDYMERVRTGEMPDMLGTELDVITDDYTASEYLSTRIWTNGGDIYIIPRERFLSLASGGIFLPLENDAPLMSVLSGASLKRGWRTDSENGETHLYGIPLDQLPGLGQYFYVEDGFACVLAFGKNVDSSLEFLRILCRDMLAAPAADGP